MTDTTKKARQRKPKGPFSDELLDQLLAQLKGKDAESLLGESGNSRNNSPSACSPPN